MEEYIMLEDGESPVPGIGKYRKGDKRTLRPEAAEGFVRQGVMEKAAPIVKPQAVKTVTGGKDNGN